MRKIVILSAVVVATIGFSSAASANHHEEGKMMMKPKVMEGGESVMIGDKAVPICKGDVQDGCINPREAGLNYGNRPLNYWPGKPASSMKKVK